MQNNVAMSKESKAKRFISDMIRCRDIEFAHIGMLVEVDGEMGTIAGMNASANLDVVFANKLKFGHGKSNCHPCWRAKYFDAKGTLIAHHDGNNWLLRPDKN